MHEPLSPHPDDVLIRALIAAPRPATPEEVARIVARMASVPFNNQVRRIPARWWGLVYGGQPLGARGDAFMQHLFQRILVDGQWVPGTTAAQYLADLHTAAMEPSARVCVLPPRGEQRRDDYRHRSRAFSRTSGARSLANLLVVHSADRGMLLTGYQFTDLPDLELPEDMQWLR